MKKRSSRLSNVYVCKRCGKRDFKSAMRFTAHLSWCDDVVKPTRSLPPEVSKSNGRHNGDVGKLARLIRQKADELERLVSEFARSVR